jgi:phosphoribosylglycinamide formyltransferase-1
VARYRIGVLASGGGSNLQAIMDHIRAGDLPADLAFVLSNNSKSGALAKARDFGAPALHVSAVTEGSEEKAAARIVEEALARKADLIVLAGYMKLIPAALLARFKNRVLNIHPALLPSFGGEGYYGHHVHDAVVRRGCQFSGITIHMVNSEYDQGQILLQRIVPLRPDWDSARVGAEVLKAEHAWYWQVVRAFATGDIVPTESDEPGKAVDASRFWGKIHGDENRA